MTEQGIKQAMAWLERGEVTYRAVPYQSKKRSDCVCGSRMNKYCRLVDSVTKPPIEDSAGKTPLVKATVHKAQRAMEEIFQDIKDPMTACISILTVNLIVLSPAAIAGAEQQYLHASIPLHPRY